ncbi:hypothetical protein SASPL_109862 [Salvia splendens]|uniref:Uncharacterized protein n=1 Tax=Salvia splendens TaxID=180675 RepID=A0A8X8YHA4_SALSN|nr:hypothetical protein SASPL_109862 [Salvia splendens]
MRLLTTNIGLKSKRVILDVRSRLGKCFQAEDLNHEHATWMLLGKNDNRLGDVKSVKEVGDDEQYMSCNVHAE